MKKYYFVLIFCLYSFTSCVGSFRGFLYSEINSSHQETLNFLKTSKCIFKDVDTPSYYIKTFDGKADDFDKKIYFVLDPANEFHFSYLFKLKNGSITDVYALLPSGYLNSSQHIEFQIKYSEISQKELNNCFNLNVKNYNIIQLETKNK